MKIGDRIGHYEILGLLGQGGMGDVFLARDLKLDRKVAIKVLSHNLQKDPASLLRFEKEARAASKLNHPNVMMIYEVGESDGVNYIASELIEGTTLRRMINTSSPALAKVLDISSQIANGIAAAHASHIVHRDIKPENVIVRDDGYAKILDFGLAKLKRHDLTADPEDKTAELTETSKGLVMGTASYMSPEQARAQTIDERTDIFSLGVVMYEMLTGRTPFTGESISETLANLLNKEPAPMARYNEDVPVELQRIVSKCLKKDREERFQSVKELLTDLNELRAETSRNAKKGNEDIDTVPMNVAESDATEKRVFSLPKGRPGSTRKWLWAAASGLLVIGLISAGFLVRRSTEGSSRTIKSIAVLPMENLSGDPDQEYFADGMTEALISNLSRIHSLKVISRTSAMQYKSSRMKLPDIAKELNVDAIVEGTVQRSGGDVLVTTQLIDPVTDTTLWSQNYKRQLSDILKLQGDIAQAVASEIRTNITAAERNKISGNRSIDPAAYEAYLQGRYHLRNLNDEGLRLAMEYFQKATAIDPDYSEAYAGLSDAYIERGIWGKLSFVEVEQPARQAALKAIEIDPESAEGLQALSTIKYNYDWDWNGAEADAVHAFAVDPNSVDVLRTYGFLLMCLGRHDEAVAKFEKIAQLDPVSSNAQSDLGRAYYRARRFEEAIPHFQKASELDPSNNSVGGRLVDTYIEMKRYEDAMAVVSNAPENKTDERKFLIYALTGHRDIALKAIEDNKVNESEKAVIYAALGDNDSAFKILQRQVLEKKTLMIFTMVEPHLEKLHSDGRWAPLMRQMNFPGY